MDKASNRFVHGTHPTTPGGQFGHHLLRRSIGKTIVGARLVEEPRLPDRHQSESIYLEFDDGSECRIWIGSNSSNLAEDHALEPSDFHADLNVDWKVEP